MFHNGIIDVCCNACMSHTQHVVDYIVTITVELATLCSLARQCHSVANVSLCYWKEPCSSLSIMLLTQIDPTPVHCSFVPGKLYSPVLSAALQNRVRAGLCHCKDTYGDLLSI